MQQRDTRLHVVSSSMQPYHIRRDIAQVVVFTHAYGDHCGVRWLAGGLKVYYAPRVTIVSQVHNTA